MNNAIRKCVIVWLSAVFFVLVNLSAELKASCQSDILGDLNNDCNVNFVDLAVVAENWLKQCGEAVPDGQSCEFDCQCASYSACVDGECTKLLDYVFIIDATATMSSEVTAFKEGLYSFFSTADMNSIDAQYCIVLYGSHPELIMEFTPDTNSVINVMDSINCFGAAVDLHADHNSNPNASLEVIRIVLDSAVDNTLVNGPNVPSGYEFAFRERARKSLILLTDEDSDRPYFEFNRFTGQDTEEPPDMFLPAQWQAEVDAAADAAVNNDVFISMIVNRNDIPSKYQYGDSNLQVQDPDFSNFNPVMTLQHLVSNGLGNCLQAQLLDAGLTSRCFDILYVDTPGAVYNLMLTTIE